jgi:ubiquinone/menaquinone biosynthesis C-methylase UbiE
MEKETYWSQFADNFDESNNYVVGKEDIDLLIKEVSIQIDLGKTLELACGNGTYSVAFSRNAETLTATDFSDEMLKVAGARLSTLENVTVEKCNAYKIGYPEESFDTVFLANCLHALANPEAIVEQVSRVLKSGGKIIVVDYTGEGMSFFNKLGMIYRFLKKYGKPDRNGKPITTKNIRPLLEAGGFRIERIDLLGQKSKAVFAVAKKAVSLTY